MPDTPVEIQAPPSFSNASTLNIYPLPANSASADNGTLTQDTQSAGFFRTALTGDASGVFRYVAEDGGSTVIGYIGLKNSTDTRYGCETYADALASLSITFGVIETGKDPRNITLNRS